MRAVEEIIARLLRIVPAWIADAVMDGVVPVKVMVGVRAVPAAIVRLERVVCPTNTSVRARHDDSFSSEPERPDVRRVRVSDAGLDCRRIAGCYRRYLNGARLRKVIVNVGVACHARDVRASSQRVGDFSSALHQNSVNDIERAMLDVAVAQPLLDRFLCAARLVQKGLINVSALLCLGGQTNRTAKVGLIS